MTLTRATALLLCLLMASPGCAARMGTRASAAVSPSERAADRAVLAEYLQRLPPGSAVRIDLAGGRVLRGTLMRTSAQSVTVQARTRIPEPPLELALEDVLRVTPESQSGTSVGKMIGIGVAAGAGAALAVFMVIVALIDD